uniref:DNA polymerase eta n=1 Tax=Globodera rostochiensis TaxID=31243 RepID=A0A914HF49_GLORO
MDEFRVVALIDMDSFYAQVEERERPECRGKPLAVVQITANGQSGQAIAVNYAARAFGVQRGMGTAEMRRICPIIHLCRVPPIDGLQEKGDLGKYRSASEEVFEVLTGFSQNIIVEKASIDEAYLDLTESCKNELANGTNEDFVRKMVSETEKLFPGTFLEMAWRMLSSGPKSAGHRDRGHTAGIARNKVLAKLVCSRHKPSRQSVIVPQNIAQLFEDTPINSVRSLGGKFGLQLMQQFSVKTMGDLQLVPHKELFDHLPESAVWLIRLLDGEDDDLVSAKLPPKSVGVSKNFPGQTALNLSSSVKKWVQGLSVELSKRLIEHESKFGQYAQNIVVGFTTSNGEHNVRTFQLVDHSQNAIRRTVWHFMKAFNKETDREGWYPHISNIHFSASRFEETERRVKKITEFFKGPQKKGENGSVEDAYDKEDSDDILFLDKEELSEDLHSPRELSEAKKDEVQVEDDGVVTSTTENVHDEIVVITLSDDSTDASDLPAEQRKKKETRKEEMKNIQRRNITEEKGKKRSAEKTLFDFFPNLTKKKHINK